MPTSRVSAVDYYLCGLDAMIDEVSQSLQQRGVHFTRIHREVFFRRPTTRAGSLPPPVSPAATSKAWR